MQQKLPIEDQLTVEEYLAMTDTRPDGERWELIEGVAILNASPTNFHQIIANNIGYALAAWKTNHDVPWVPMLGMGTRVPVSPRSLPQPDIQVLSTVPTGEASRETKDGLVLFEVISKSNTRTDQAWRLKAYTSIPNCQHYVALAQDKPVVTRYDRTSSWRPTAIAGINATLELPALGVAIPLSLIYRWTPAGEVAG
jgi:Uma2 family endonuclease